MAFLFGFFMSICAKCLCLFCQIPLLLTLQIAVRMHAIVAILFYGIFIGRFFSPLFAPAIQFKYHPKRWYLNFQVVYKIV